MRILSAKDYAEMSAKAGRFIIAQVILKPDSVLGLATGSTPVGAYQFMAEKYREGKVSFAACQTINLDEYQGLSPEDEASYRYFMEDKLFRHIDIAAENTYLPNGKASDPAAECANYDKLIADIGPIDLQLLGIGHNGHIAFNEPGEAFVPGTHLVDLDQSTIDANKRFFESEADVPRRAFTMGLGSILNARRILLLVSGKEKADILRDSLIGPITPKVPASILQFHPDLTVIADEAALSALQ